ncbi:hypothetical protein ACFFK0_07405 [Paenibacillus chartarius]|uniref:Uncharacterized protein n=1 Tax=Paenibacillus chartarius TaxID=747481 RepID=A0ABV6DI01_9BACL
MSETKQDDQKVVELERYRQERTEQERSVGETEHVWERTSQPLLPGSELNGEHSVRIVKVSSGFGRLQIPGLARKETSRCMAA